MEAELAEKMWLSCPFCGDSDTVLEEICPVDKTRWVAMCMVCGTCGPPRDTQNDARKAWNTRYAVWPADDGAQYGYDMIGLKDREKMGHEIEEEWYDG